MRLYGAVDSESLQPEIVLNSLAAFSDHSTSYGPSTHVLTLLCGRRRMKKADLDFVDTVFQGMG